jgi:hypothetical protein
MSLPVVNLLKTKINLLYIRNQFVPCSIPFQQDLYFCTVHVVTFTLFNTNSCTYFKHSDESVFESSALVGLNKVNFPPRL